MWSIPDVAVLHHSPPPFHTRAGYVAKEMLTDGLIGPAHVTSSWNVRRWLDMEVDGDVVSVAVPKGVYYSRGDFFAALQEAGRDQHPKILSCFGIRYTKTVPFVSIDGSLTTSTR